MLKHYQREASSVGCLMGRLDFPLPDSLKSNFMFCGPEGDGLAEAGVSCIPSSTSGNSYDGRCRAESSDGFPWKQHLVLQHRADHKAKT